MAYRHKHGRGYIASGYDPATKSKKHLGTYTTKREAVRAEADWKTRFHPTGSETCRQFAERWPVDYPRPRASTAIANRDRLKPFIRDLGHLKLTAVDRPTARAWALKNQAAHAAVRAMFSDALRDGLVDHNPFTNLRMPTSRGRADIVALTEPQLVALADCALDAKMELGDLAPQFRAMVLFAGYVGLRPGELFALQRADIRGELCTIERALDSKTRTVGPTKNGRMRVVTVPPAARAALDDVPLTRSGLLFVNHREQMWTRTSHHYHWKQLRNLAGRPGLDHYELRHCAATMLLERGVTPWDIAVQLGHMDGGRLVQLIYGHPREEGARQRMLAAWDQEIKPLRVVGGQEAAS
jgi:integrase